MFQVTYVTPSGRVSTCEMSERSLRECGFEIVEAVRISD